jgi:hypothetical protein
MVRDCMAQHWLEYALRRDLIAADRCAVDNIKARFRTSGDLADLLVAITTDDLFRSVLVEGATP